MKTTYRYIISKPSYYYDTIIRYYDRCHKGKQSKVYSRYDTIITTLWHYYDTIITSIMVSIMTKGTIMTLLWHYYDNIMIYYDRISAPSLSEFADGNRWTEHREMIIKWPWRLELDFNQQEGAQQEWKAAGVSGPVQLYTLFLPLYSLLQMSDQDCCCSKNVLRTADMRATIQGVTSSWGSTRQAVFVARRAETVLCADYYLSLWHYYFTYFINYHHYYKTRSCDSAWNSLKKQGHRHPPSHGISVRR